MGFDIATIEFLLRAKKNGTSFARVLTIGRQGLHVTEQQLASVLRQNGIELPSGECRQILTEQNGFCEPLLRHLGAVHVDSVDASHYEGATIIHDMNQPLAAEYHNRYSTVIDGGSLEHVFNFPVALKNCMAAVETGGHFIGITPGNNLMGHGFYQFSPELFFRVFTRSNGFQMEQLLVVELGRSRRWYEVVDPERVGSRVELVNSRSAYLYIRARKTASVPMFQEVPQQSDYMSLWRQARGRTLTVAETRPHRTGSFLKRHLPAGVAALYRRYNPFRPRYFKKIV